ncbi:MAG: DEAD/DEAH box helicase [Paracoccus sp. (in: a-proteobacteria)]|uniref:DEAD/DEAH box helicase n=1 Tax=Paracoccus sp. TaxID=267 RepID=UPI0026DF1953|nr:DEAD/DEAH box helicase [Paracoccus sp. (in: a-proteobacteria)]MDO5620256.1 DEAD/DEAH box helicase [Paracoccus sp. (in: a-proteobacteria)]
MIHPDLAPALAEALAAKGYDSLTAVQQAVLAPEAAGRDLLVSAQTGSGKTVAFGLALGPDLAAVSGLPLALVIAPTRELALQVARELGWLHQGAQVATVVGGMEYRGQLRALAAGPQIVVGTPGRLRDHIERGSLDLSGLRAVVLDEADEMLDLGFREDLEFILAAAPESRRTLLFSATVPPAIEALARDFQRDALRLTVGGEARQHGDITYRAVTVQPRDREPAIFNLLRYYEPRTAIVFCKTRANVAHLLARMGNRGFRAVALSGELSQQERSHALLALRDGRAQVCIATDVAARGIDLPGLDLVIHADLPTNAETLLHRSGRTGRAGAKGVSALIVPLPDRGKATRLLRFAKLEAEWVEAPSADAVRAADDERMLTDPVWSGGDEDGTALLERFGADAVAAAFVRLWRGGRPAPEELIPVQPSAPAAPRAPRGEFGPSVWFTVSAGHEDRAEARWLLPKICEAGGITRDLIGAIRVKQRVTFVQLAEAAAAHFGAGHELEPGLTMLRMETAPDFDAPTGPAPKKPHRKGQSFSKAAFDKAPSGKTSFSKPPFSKAPRDEDAPRPAKPAPKAAKPAAKPAKTARTTAPKPAAKAARNAAEKPAGKPYAPKAKAPRSKAAAGKPSGGKPAYGKPARPSRSGPPRSGPARPGGTSAPRRPKG